jgi:mycothiol synthase
LSEVTVRPAALSDAPELERMFTRCAERYLGRSTSREEALDRLTQAGPDPKATALVAETPAGQIVGFGNVWPAESGEVKCFARVDPNATGLGIGASLLERLEAKAKGLGRILTVTQWAADESAEGLLRSRGFEPTRYFLRMVGDLSETPDDEPPLPPGISVRGFLEQGDEDMIFEAWSVAFASESGGVPESPDAWWRERRDAQAAGFDPELWLVAVADGEIVGFSICKEIEDGDARIGYVSDLGVRPDQRGRGLGSALLLLSFGAMRRRGLTRVSLDVDAENTTSALRLYRKVGLREEPRFTIWAKPLTADASLRSSR